MYEELDYIYGLALVFTAQEVMPKMFGDRYLTSDVLTAKELHRLKIEMTLSLLMAFFSFDEEQRDKLLMRFWEQEDFLESVSK